MPIAVYKNIGETPLQVLNRLRNSDVFDGDRGVRLSYAGRLDPMAEGLLLVLVGDECNQGVREQYLALDKEYEVEVLFGVETDSYDLLGLPKFSEKIHKDFKDFIESLNVGNVKIGVRNVIGSFVGDAHGLKYPPYSSKTVDGESLFKLARDGTSGDFELPTIKGSIYSIEIISFTEIGVDDLLKYVRDNVTKVSGDFRQEEILKSWAGIGQLSNLENFKFQICKISVKCQSGVYMRSLATSIGDRFGLPALAFSIKRTRIGSFSGETVSKVS